MRKGSYRMRHSVILIPSLNPDKKLVPYVEELFGEGFEHIIVVNDGSKKEFEPVFYKLEAMGCIVLKHAVNYGKGRALKNGFNEFLNRFSEDEEICGIITADSDGQHLVKDVICMDQELFAGGNGERLLLGTRRFDRENVPFKSRFGNKLTCFFFRILYGLKVSDTQTGLRGITARGVKSFLALKGERFEYETSMLIAAVRNKIPVEEVPISTVYLENNSGTHFKPLQDSFRIYSILFGEFFKYILSSLSASGIDLVIFHFLAAWIPGAAGIWASTIIARIISSFYNYMMKRKVVFASGEEMKRSLWRYYLLCVVQGGCSAALVSAFVSALSVPKTACKVVVDTALFFISYQIQRRFVFSEKK